jgi:hypothetical protein
MFTIHISGKDFYKEYINNSYNSTIIRKNINKTCKRFEKNTKKNVAFVKS